MGQKVSKNLNEETYLWSTNPNLVLSLKKFLKLVSMKNMGKLNLFKNFRYQD